VVVAPAGATFTNPKTGAATAVGSQVDVHVTGQRTYRDFSLLLADDEPIIGGSFMPYPLTVDEPSLINYRTAGTPLEELTLSRDDANFFSSRVNGDPKTPLLRAYAGDRVVFHALAAPGSEQIHVFSMGGQTWALDPEIPRSNELTAREVGAWQVVDGEINGGAGGRAAAPGDYFYGDLRRPFTQGAMWGLMRVYDTTQPDLKPVG
jgi:manganese oxidase